MVERFGPLYIFTSRNVMFWRSLCDVNFIVGFICCISWSSADSVPSHIMNT